MKSPSPQGQLKIDFNYDDRVERLAKEYELMLIPYVPPGTTRETTRNLAGRLAILAGKRLELLYQRVKLVFGCGFGGHNKIRAYMRCWKMSCCSSSGCKWSTRQSLAKAH